MAAALRVMEAKVLLPAREIGGQHELRGRNAKLFAVGWAFHKNSGKKLPLCLRVPADVPVEEGVSLLLWRRV